LYWILSLLRLTKRIDPFSIPAPLIVAPSTEQEHRQRGLQTRIPQIPSGL
jgi:hypothetical protein